MPLSLEMKIRLEAASKIKVRITNRKKSQNGFDITFLHPPTRDGITYGRGYRNNQATKKAAMQHLLAVLRCMSPIEISITPAKPVKK